MPHSSSSPGGMRCGGGGGASEIEEEIYAEDVAVRQQENGKEVYVAVGKKGSSVDALAWALKNAAEPGDVVYLVHVFPEIRQVSTPLGMLPKDQINPLQLETYMSREREKRRVMLQKFLNMCNVAKIKVETLLIESDLTAKAIIDLIPVLNIRTLIIGTSRTAMRKLGKGSSKAEEVWKRAPHYCQVTVICKGNKAEFIEKQSSSMPPSPHPANGKAEKVPPRSQTTKNKELKFCKWFCKNII